MLILLLLLLFLFSFVIITIIITITITIIVIIIPLVSIHSPYHSSRHSPSVPFAVKNHLSSIIVLILPHYPIVIPLLKSHCSHFIVNGTMEILEMYIYIYYIYILYYTYIYYYISIQIFPYITRVTFTIIVPCYLFQWLKMV